MRGGFRRIGVLALVLCVLAQPVVMPAMASASSPEEDDCENYDYLGGSYYSNESPSACEVEKSYQNATQYDVSAAAKATASQQAAVIAQWRNLINTSDTFLRSKVKATAIRELRNGTNVSQTQEIVNETVDNRTSKAQTNMISSWNTTTTQAIYLSNISTEQAGDTGWYVVYANRNRSVSAYDFQAVSEMHTNKSDSQTRFVNITTQDVTLANGTTVEAQRITQWDENPVEVANHYNLTDVNGYADPYFKTWAVWHTQWDFSEESGATNPDDSNFTRENATVFLDTYDYSQVWLRLDQQNTRIKKNAAQYIEGINSTYTTEELNNITVLDAVTIAQEYATNQNSTGYYSWYQAEAALQGMNSSVNASFTVEYDPAPRYVWNNSSAQKELVDPQNVTLTGGLATNWDPTPGSTPDFEVNTTYNTSNAGDQPMFFFNQTNNGTELETLDGEFTITQISDQVSGESLNSTTLDDDDYQTNNETFLKEEMIALLEERDATIQSAESGGGGGTGGDGFNFGFDFGSASIGFIAIIGGALLLLSNR